MRNWIHPRAFLCWALLIFVLRLTKIPEEGIAAEWIGATLFQMVVGGLFWGAISTYLYNRFNKP